MAVTTTTAPPGADDDGYVPPLMTPNAYQQMRMGLRLSFYSLFADKIAMLWMSIPMWVILLIFLLPPLIDDPTIAQLKNNSDPSEMATLPLDYAQWDPQLVVPYHMSAGGALADALGAAGAGSGYTPASFETSAALLEALESTSTNAVAAFGMVPTSRGCTMLYNMSVVAATPLAVRLLDAAYLAQLDPTLSLAPSAALLPYVGDDPPPLPGYLGSDVVPAVLIYMLMFIGMIIVQALVKDRLVEKTTHSLLVMGLSPKMRWVNDCAFWSILMWTYLAVGPIVMLIFHGYAPSAAAVPAFTLICLLAVPSIYCFLALFNFIFWCRSNVEDVVTQTYCNIISIAVLYPTIFLSITTAVFTDPLFRSALTYILVILPFNQLTFGLTSVYLQFQAGQYRQVYEGAPPLGVGDYFAFEITVPNQPGHAPGPAISLVASVLTLPFWFWLIWLVDVKRYYQPNSDPGESHRHYAQGAHADGDVDVAAERARVEDGRADSALVRMVHLRKTFKAAKKRVDGKMRAQPDKVAVADLSLAIDGQGCFALLGPNGAGKTTTLSMITGDLRPAGGEAYVDGLSVRTEIMSIFKKLGYCPQFGGLFPRGVSLKAHLALYGRLKGVPEAELAAHVARVMREFGVEEHANKWTMKLSGGTRRKLMAAIALACEPRVCFLDEPTTGVDVGTRQFLWERIRAKGRRGCALILTTHYMEEADALAQRVGIMVNGKLKVLGSPQHLKSTHGGGYRIELKGPAATAEQATALVHSLFPDCAQLDLRGGYQVFEVGKEKVSAPGGTRDALFALGPVFSALDQAKADLGIESYTLSQTTLEQVFLNISSEQLDDTAGPVVYEATATATEAKPRVVATATATAQ